MPLTTTELEKAARMALAELAPRLGVQPSKCRMTVLAAQPEAWGGRVTMRVDAPAGPAMVLKLRVGLGAAARFDRMLAGHARAAEALAGQPHHSVPAVLAQDADMQAVLLDHLPGRTAAALLADDPGSAAEVLRIAGGWLGALHGGSAMPAAQVDLLAAARKLRLRAEENEPAAPGRFWALFWALRRAAVAAERTPLPQALLHGDFSADNLLIDGDRSAGIDLEHAATGLPARDIAMFLVDVATRTGPPDPALPPGALLPGPLMTAFFGAYEQDPGPVEALDYAILLRMAQIWLATPVDPAARTPEQMTRWRGLIAAAERLAPRRG